MKLLEAIKEKMAGRQLSRLQQLRKLRADVADEKDVDEDLLVELLEQLQTTPDEFAEQVELLKQRRQWLVEVKAAEEAQQKIGPFDRKIEEGETKLKELIDAHRKKINLIHEERNRISDIAIRGSASFAQLQQTSNDEAVAEEREVVISKLQDVRKKIENAEHHINVREQWIEAARSGKSFHNFHDRRRMLEKAKPDMKEFKAKRKQLAAEQEELQTQLEQLSSSYLDPNAF